MANRILYVGGAVAMVHYGLAEAYAAPRGLQNDTEPPPVSIVFSATTSVAETIVMNTMTDEPISIPPHVPIRVHRRG